jgi:undecaprenyl diphosphate synthase
MDLTSSTQEIPDAPLVPRHIAIIMDGNGRWATSRYLPRVTGHVKGVEAVRGVVQACAERGVKFLTLFAFSSENWRRPAEEVSMLMRLFVSALEREVKRMHASNLQKMIEEAQAHTAANTGLTLTVCANYGGRWDVMQATQKMMAAMPGVTDFTEEDLARHLVMAYAPEPDLFIRTGGEQRISNFLLWQLAYAELYFTDTYWPDFDAASLDAAILSYQQRERRFGRTSAQVQEVRKAS